MSLNLKNQMALGCVCCEIVLSRPLIPVHERDVPKVGGASWYIEYNQYLRRFWSENFQKKWILIDFLCNIIVKRVCNMQKAKKIGNSDLNPLFWAFDWRPGAMYGTYRDAPPRGLRFTLRQWWASCWPCRARSAVVFMPAACQAAFWRANSMLLARSKTKILGSLLTKLIITVFNCSIFPILFHFPFREQKNQQNVYSEKRNKHW